MEEHGTKVNSIHVRLYVAITWIELFFCPLVYVLASGGGEPVSGSFLWELIHFRIRGSAIMTIIDPTPMPEKARPEKPGDLKSSWS
jgi:hypothetical protein